MNNNLDTNALFLGSKAENADIFEKMLLEAFRDHTFWRKNFHPEDPLLLSQTEKRSKKYEKTVDDFQTAFDELLSRLKKSVPFHSPRYVGHMLSDLLMPGMIGYFATMLYNQNNVSYEASPVTSQLEIEVGEQLATMFGFKPEKAWAHLTSGGTVANIEAMWVIRNLKYFPLIAHDLLKKYNKNLVITRSNSEEIDISNIKTDFELLSLEPKVISHMVKDFMELDWGCDIQQEIFKHERNISHAGMGNKIPTGKVLIPASKHYSWPKAAEILGIGRSNIEPVKVDEKFRADVNDLREKLVKFHNEKIPVLAVVGVVGSTECASIDSIDKIVETRKWYEKEYNSSFYIHLDAAYGGYPRSIFLNSDDTFRSLEEIQDEFKDSEHVSWPSEEIYNAYKSMNEVDSITVDPHKLGYIPYPAGAIIFKDKNVKSATLCKAPYINNNEDAYIGSYILEGSKPGASAAACWLAHKVTPLNKNGYGKIISDPVGNAHILYDILKAKTPMVVETKDGPVNVQIEILTKPDLDILLYAFNIEGNKSLAKMNEFNEKILQEFTFDVEKVTGAHDFIISSTEFAYDIYGDALISALDNLGIDKSDWTDNVQKLKLLRSSIVTSLVNKNDLRDFYWNNFVKALEKALSKILN